MDACAFAVEQHVDNFVNDKHTKQMQPAVLFILETSDRTFFLVSKILSIFQQESQTIPQVQWYLRGMFEVLA